MLSKRWLIPILASTLLLAEFGVYASLPAVTQDVSYSGNINFEPPNLWTDPLVTGHSIVQKFQVQQDNLTEVQLFMSTFARTNTSKLHIQLAENEASFLDKIISTQTIQNDAYLNIDFPRIKNSAGKTFVLTISSLDGTPTNAVATRYSYSPLPNTQLTIDGASINGTLFMIPYYQSSSLTRLSLMAERVNVNKGGYAPPVLTFVILAALFWTLNAWIVSWFFSCVTLSKERP